MPPCGAENASAPSTYTNTNTGLRVAIRRALVTLRDAQPNAHSPTPNPLLGQQVSFENTRDVRTWVDTRDCSVQLLETPRAGRGGGGRGAARVADRERPPRFT